MRMRLARLALGCCALLAGPTVSLTAKGQSLVGVNLAGAAYSSDKLPGRYGYDFLYPNADEIRYFAAKGLRVFRLSVLWERVQPRLEGPLDPGEISRLERFVSEASAVGGSVIIDIHNYGSYRSTPLDHGDVTRAAFADLWSRIASQFGESHHVIFGLMNEPQLSDAAGWRDDEQAAIDAIRRTGAINKILVSGLAWDAAQNFATVSGPTLGMLVDPLGNLLFEVHEYFDPSSSGTSDVCVSAEQAIARLAPMTQWLARTRHQGFLGEFGISRRPECLQVLGRVIAYLQANRAEWFGWTYWAAGPLWGNYMFTIEPEHGRDRPQMTVIEQQLGRADGHAVSR